MVTRLSLTHHHTTMLHEITGNLGKYSLQENITIIYVIDVWNKCHFFTRDNNLISTSYNSYSNTCYIISLTASIFSMQLHYWQTAPVWQHCDRKEPLLLPLTTCISLHCTGCPADTIIITVETGSQSLNITSPIVKKTHFAPGITMFLCTTEPTVNDQTFYMYYTMYARLQAYLLWLSQRYHIDSPYVKHILLSVCIVRPTRIIFVHCTVFLVTWMTAKHNWR